MDRKTFLKILLKTGLSAGCCGAAMGWRLLAQGMDAGATPGQEEQDWIRDFEKRMVKATETPAWRRAQKSQLWIKNLMSNLDSMLDRETGVRLMHACGKSCFLDAFGVASVEKPLPEAAEHWMKYLKDSGFAIEEEGEITVVHYSWGRDHQNPWGLMIQDGYCMCPVVESIPKGLSPTFCNCSAGYVREMFQRYLARPVKVDLVESLQMGADDCRFRIEFSKV
ncbi:MAG: DUF6144 family protein [Planctomycetota bacterium]